MKNLRGLLLVTTVLTAFAAHAQSENPLTARENRIAPIVSYLMSKGVKLTSLGEVGGIQGYLGEDATGNMQAFYVTPDGKHVIGGILFGPGGKNITGIQIGEMRARFDAAAREFEAATVTSSDEGLMEPVDGGVGGLEPVSNNSIGNQEHKNTSDQEASISDVKIVVPEPVASANSNSTSSDFALALPEANAPLMEASGNPSELWISKLDRDEFIREASELPYFEVGSTGAPSTLWLVADPQCPFCHKAWEHVRSSVYNRKLKVRVILIAGIQGSDKIAIDMLSRPLPARAWLDSDGGKNFKLEVDTESSEYLKAQGFVERNMDFVRKFNFDRTPFMAYVADDGKFYSTLGLPGDLNSFFAASGI